MGRTILEKKFQALEQEEKRINDYFDVTKRHKVQHPWIDDMRQDFKADLQNFGTSPCDDKLFRGTTSQEPERRTTAWRSPMS
jgi:hypothetical protein